MEVKQSEVRRRLKQGFECPFWVITSLIELIAHRTMNSCHEIDCEDCRNQDYYDSDYFDWSYRERWLCDDED